MCTAGSPLGDVLDGVPGGRPPGLGRLPWSHGTRLRGGAEAPPRRGVLRPHEHTHQGVQGRRIPRVRAGPPRLTTDG